MKHYNDERVPIEKQKQAKKWKCVCNPIQDTYRLSIDKNTGLKTLKKCGTENVYEKIQQYKQETDIYHILAMCGGDPEALKKFSPKEEDFKDISEMPTSLFDAHQKIEQAKAQFYELPLEIRKAYDNNISNFIKDLNNTKLQEAYNEYIDNNIPKTETKKEEKKETE